MNAKFYGKIFKMAAKHSGKVLDIQGDKKLVDNAPLQQANYGGYDNQKFLIFPVDDAGKYFVIASLAGSTSVCVVPGRGVK